MTREITLHQAAGDKLNSGLEVFAIDEAGPGGANHAYLITAQQRSIDELLINFQKGGVEEVGGVNGISMEALLAICADRLECFQKGPFPSDYNQVALDCIKTALHAMESRSKNRIERGVEGQLVS